MQIADPRASKVHSETGFVTGYKKLEHWLRDASTF
jgi:hypothetical protein